MRIAYIIRADGGSDPWPAYDVDEFPYGDLAALHINCKYHKVPKHYLRNICGFDIEATTIEAERPYGFMYHWQFCIDGKVCVGRRWEEFFRFLDRLRTCLGYSWDSRLIIYVFNLPYEYQFIRLFLDKYCGGHEVFAVDKRKPLYVSTKSGLEFRCAYKLTNMSLYKATVNEKGVIHIKAQGDLEYRKLRTADTPLTDEEFGYCVSDVVSLYELIKCRLANEKDDLEYIPMTSTGYVRRDCRNITRLKPSYRDFFLKQSFDQDVYLMLKAAGRGGDTHANRHFAGKIWQDVKSFDFQSSYPAQLMNNQYPVTRFILWGTPGSVGEVQGLLRTYACLFTVVFKNLRCKPMTPMPYIPLSKTQYRGSDIKLDNGRILSADVLQMVVTDIDWKIISDQYEWDSIALGDFYIAKYGYLPDILLSAVMKYFKQKCELKAQIKKEKDPEKLADLQYLYMKSKNRLNGIFGMMYTDPVRDEVTIDEDGTFQKTTPDIDKMLARFWKSRNSFVAYQWGVWTTCWGRYWLSRMVLATNNPEDGSHVLYCDTDSSKAIGVNMDRIDALNDEIVAICEERGSYCDVEGKRYYLGIAEYEGMYDRFRTLGAKKYAYEEGGELHVTVSGVNKAEAPAELEKLENFVPGFIFRKAGGVTLYYNNDFDIGIHDITIDGCTMTTASNIGMVDSTYELGLTDEYADLIGYNLILDNQDIFA